MKVLMNINDLEKLINSDGISIILIGSAGCMPCKAIGARIDSFLASNKDIKGIYVELECFKEYLASMSILSVPTVLVYAMGKLQIKEAGYFSLDKIFNSILRIKELIS